MKPITIIDYLLLPIYLSLFFWWVRRMSVRYTELKKYMFTAFWLRMLGSVLYGMLIQYYYGIGDSFTFYYGNIIFREQISADFSNFANLFAPFEEMLDWYNSFSTDGYFSSYFSAPSSNMIMRISTLFSYLCFNRYLIISIFFGLFSFFGQWKLFLVLNEINRRRNVKLLAFAVLYSPSIWFWGSGLMKDSICLGGLGFIIHILYKFFVRKKFSVINLLFLVFLYYVVTIIKSYIVNIVVVGLVAMFLTGFIQTFKSKVIRVIMVGFSIILFLSILYISDFTSQIIEITEESIAQIQSFQSGYEGYSNTEETSRAGFGLGDLDPTLTGLILKSPAVIFTVLFRPFLWESRSVFILFTSLECFLLFLSTFYLFLKLGLLGFFKVVFRTPALLFCFTITMLFALIIGFTTFNFGTMIRYKIIFLPFYYFMLVYMYCTYKDLKASPA